MVAYPFIDFWQGSGSRKTPQQQPGEGAVGFVS
jgi:hypothetical protein